MIPVKTAVKSMENTIVVNEIAVVVQISNGALNGQLINMNVWILIDPTSSRFDPRNQLS